MSGSGTRSRISTSPAGAEQAASHRQRKAGYSELNHATPSYKSSTTLGRTAAAATAMTDITKFLPSFPTDRFARLLAVLEQHDVTTTDLLTRDVGELASRTRTRLVDLQRLVDAVLGALHVDLGVRSNDAGGGVRQDGQGRDNDRRRQATGGEARTSVTRTLSPPNPQPPPPQPQFITTLDPVLDAALGGGVPTGYVTEIVGESGAGKTQLLLSLLLAVQLAPERGGLGRPALYVSTEAPLSTRRLTQMLAANQTLKDAAVAAESGDGMAASTGAGAAGGGGPMKQYGRGFVPGVPSLDGIVSTVTPDLESQDHILTYQVPVEVARRNIGLVVVDSIAANYRAEFDLGGMTSLNARRDDAGKNGTGSHQAASMTRTGASNMGARSVELARLGRQLRELAWRNGLAVVVANQVADRFVGDKSIHPGLATATTQQRPPLPWAPTAATQESPLASRSTTKPSGAAPLLVPSSSIPSQSNNDDNGDVRNDKRVVAHIEPPLPSISSSDPCHPALQFDHQQRWFTGWGDDPFSTLPLKTPSLGLVWTTQVAMRVALLKRASFVVQHRDGQQQHYRGDEGAADDYDADEGSAAMTKTTWRRWLKVVFAPHVAPSKGQEIVGATEFEITMAGLRAVVTGSAKRRATDAAGRREGTGGPGGGGKRKRDDDGRREEPNGER